MIYKYTPLSGKDNSPPLPQNKRENTLLAIPQPEYY
jgi:hypothetical protein